MVNISILLYFLAGIIFAQWGMPLFDSLISIILQKCEVVKGKMAIQVTKYALETDQLKGSNEKSQAIGFAISNEEQDDYEDD